jgi:Na+-driven multidrug efflux pump
MNTKTNRESESVSALPIADSKEKTSIWVELKKALLGAEEDYTKISLKKALFLLSVPMMLELALESIFAVADIYFVGSLGESAVATVGLTETYLFLLYSVAMGLAMAVTAIIALHILFGPWRKTYSHRPEAFTV